MIAILTKNRRLLADKRGATAIEYGLIAALIGVTCMGAISTLGGGTGGMWTRIATSVDQAM